MSDGQVHSRYGGSIADRWMNCAGSVALCQIVPKAPSSIYAEEGTRAHGLAQYCLENGFRSAMKAVGSMPPGQLGTDYSIEMCDAVQVYLDAVWSELEAASDAELHVEQSFTFPGMNGEVFGRNDALVYSASRKRLAVFDYKHGAGISVTAEDNSQLKFYAAGALLDNPEWIVSEIELMIVQPRARDTDKIGAVRRWPMDVLDVLNFSAEISEAVGKARNAENLFQKYNTKGWTIGFVDGHLKTGSWCRWCDAAAICPARERESMNALGLAFQGVADVDVTELDEPAHATGERLAQIMTGLAVLEGWASRVREFVESHMLTGQLQVPGWKVVHKVGRLKWVASDEAITADLALLWGLTENDVMSRKLLGFTDLRKVMKSAGASGEEIAEFEARYTIKESSGLTIAPASDRRDAVSPAALFDGVQMET